jgi:flagella basal body P-ring formation protein FlgA
VVATKTIAAGQRIEQPDVRLETDMGLPDQRIKTFATIEDFVGQNARRTIVADAPLSERDVVKAPAVARGDVIRVDVHAGRAHVSFEGIAQASASVGEFVAVKNTETRKVMRARVASRGNAVVNLDR